MKFLIWFLCILANALITTFFKGNGVILGAIPTTALFAGTIWLAKTLCKEWDLHKAQQGSYSAPSEKHTQGVVMPLQDAAPSVSSGKSTYCPKCGSKLLDDAIFCNNCGAEIEKE